METRKIRFDNKGDTLVLDVTLIFEYESEGEFCFMCHDFFNEHILNEECDYRSDEAERFDNTCYGTLDDITSQMLPELIKTEAGRQQIKDAILLIDPYIINAE